MHIRLPIALILSSLGSSSAFAQAPAIYGIGDLPGGGYSSSLTRLSGDGRFAVGRSTGTAGSGRSLERVRFDSDASDPAAWIASNLVGGSPGGAVPPTAPSAAIRIDEVFASNEGQILRGNGSPDFVELLGIQPGTDLSNWSVSRADRTNRLVFPSGTRLEQGDRLVVWFGEAAPGDLAVDVRLDSQAGVVVVHDAAGSRRAVFAYGPQGTNWSVGFAADNAGPLRGLPLEFGRTT